MKSKIVLLLLGCSLFIWCKSIAAEEQKSVDLVVCLDEAMLGYGEQKKGYCDRKSGKLIIKYQFKSANDFSEGLAAVINDKRDAYYINATGEKAFDLPAGASSLADFSEGLARVKIDRRYGYVDNKGEIAIEPRFEDAQETFKEGMALVKELVNISGTEFAERYSWIDKTGKVTIKPRFTKAQKFSDGLAMVSYIKGKKKIKGFITDNKIIGFIDKTGKEVITLDEDTSMLLEKQDVFREDFEDRYGFSGGLAWIMSPKTGRYYAINKRGNIEFKDVVGIEVYRFSEGLSAIRLGGESGWAYINKKGNVIIPPIDCSRAYSFSDGLARCGQNGIYIDKQGEKVINGRFSADDFSGGTARVTMRAGNYHLLNYIDKTGKYLWKFKVSPELMKAAKEGDTATVEQLIEKENVDVDATDKDGLTALMWTAVNGRLATAELLITKGADINASDKGGNTPLRYAAANDRTDVAKILIEKSADINAKDNKGVTPLKRAIEKGHTAMAELLRSYGAKE